MWTRKRTWPDSVDDWSVLYKGMAIARVHIPGGSPGAPPWGWGIYIGPMNGGRVLTMEEGLEAARNALLAIGPDMERIARKYTDNAEKSRQASLRREQSKFTWGA